MKYIKAKTLFLKAKTPQNLKNKKRQSRKRCKQEKAIAEGIQDI